MPLSYAEPLYHLRLHIELLRDKLKQTAAGKTPWPKPAAPPPSLPGTSNTKEL